MEFIVQEQNQKTTPVLDKKPYVVLTRDNWDDYGYKTTFSATLYLSDESFELGGVKILHADQVSGYTEMPEGTFRFLGQKYCSLGTGIDYYEKLFKCGPKVFRTYLQALKDAAYNKVKRARFEEQEGYQVSLLRIAGAERMIRDAANLLGKPPNATSAKTRSRGFALPFKTQVAQDATPFLIEFDFRRKGSLPNRINVVIGYNGTGKTQLLSNLAIAASNYGYDSKEDQLEESAGRFVDVQPFQKVVVVSYSAFDTFVIPGQSTAERKRLREDGDIFGYAYCGLRKSLKNETRKGTQYRLRTPDEIQKEFITAFERVHDADRSDALVRIIRPLLMDASFQRIGLSSTFASSSTRELRKLFRSLSSGHKIVLKILVDMAAHMDGTKPTLVLLDEPETHLHPPLLAAMLQSVRACLDEFNGYAIVATHSPVVLQETPSRYVHVLKRMGFETSAVPVSIETFGENVGVITQDVFNLDDGSTDWHDTLRRLAKKHTLEEIEARLGRRLGFAARSYVLSLMQDAEDE
jgi:predicted ATPase